ncbi:MAG: hypothetical protein WCC00_03910 [Candidatus Aminicenantales bacterium]
MTMAKPCKWPLILVLALAAVVCLFFFHMYHDDINALKGFIAAYEKFDQAVSDLSTSASNDVDGKAGESLVVLNAKAPLRLSSLIKNDAELMDQAREVADLSQRELDGLKAQDAMLKSRNPDSDGAKGRELDKDVRVLREKRQAAYARFRELCGND